MSNDDDAAPRADDPASPGARSGDPVAGPAAAPHADDADNVDDADDVAAPAPAFPWPEAPVAANLRKARVRAALFHKSEPIRVGRFILLEPLGAGAMGEIYAAYDERLDRKVALKLVRGGSDLTARADERLLREAQTLAQVSHPNVVQIYEAGTYDGRLFIAMELVHGKTLSAWLRDAAQLPRAVRQREILGRFIAAGRGLEAAHAAGVAHRDFKPDNVLVGDDGRVRVVDFGLARALGDDATAGSPAAGERGPDEGRGASAISGRGDAQLRNDLGARSTVVLGRGGAAGTGGGRAAEAADEVPFATGASTLDLAPEPAAEPGGVRDPASSAPRLKAALRLTETGTVMGTPFFMAPEQMRGVLADRRSDQFSFCVALYHALYDAFPFSGKSLRELRDSMASDEIAFAPGVPVPAFVREALHRGLAVSPDQRFATMTELLAALEPRRRRRGWISGAVGLLVIAAGAAVVLGAHAPADPCAAAGAGIDAAWSADRQVLVQAAFRRSELSFAGSAWRGVKARLDDYARGWRREARAACQATHVAHTQSTQLLDKRILCLDHGRSQLAALATELAVGAPDTIEHAIEASGALPAVDACSRTENLLFGLAPPPPPLAGDVAALRDRLSEARTLELLGRYDDALAIARAASARAEHLGYPAVHAEALVQVARALDVRSTTDTRREAERLYFQALTLAEAERHDPLAVEIWTQLVRLAVRMDSGMAQAHEWWGQAQAWLRRSTPAIRVGEDTAHDQAELHYLLGEIYFRESEYAKAADEERQAIAAVPRAAGQLLALSRYDGALAKALDRLGERDEAMQLYERALASATEILGAGHPRVTLLEINYGRALKNRGRHGEARTVLEHALASLPPRSREAHPDAARIHGFLSELACGEGDLDRAAEHARTSLQIYERTMSLDHPSVAEAYTNLANVEFLRRNFRDALALYERALGLRRHHLGSDHYQVGLAEGSVAETLLALERSGDAMAHLVEAERIFARGSGRDRSTQAWLLTVRGEILVAERDFGSAVGILERTVGLVEDDVADVADRNTHALAVWTLARALHGLGKDPGRVRTLADRAHALFAGLGALGAHDRDAVARFVARLPRPAAPR